MYIQKIHIENFRLLKNVDIVLDKSLTLIVGKNNTGKTSVAHLPLSLYWLTRCSENLIPSFPLFDFLSQYF